MANERLTRKQQKFVQEYLIDLNATRAAERAGYSERTAYSQGQRLLKHVEVKKAIDAAIERRNKRLEVTQDRIIKEYARLGFFDPRQLFRPDGSPKDITELDDDTAAAIAGLEVMEIWEGRGEDRRFVGYLKKYKLANKIGALDSIARHLGMFNDRLELGGKVSVDNPFAGLTTEDLKKLIEDDG